MRLTKYGKKHEIIFLRNLLLNLRNTMLLKSIIIYSRVFSELSIGNKLMKIYKVNTLENGYDNVCVLIKWYLCLQKI